MIKRITAFALLVLFAFLLYGLVASWLPIPSLTALARYYAAKAPEELGAANIVTAVVVTYRGLDTLGEVAVLFLAATGVGLLLRKRETAGPAQKRRHASEILGTGAAFLVPVIITFGASIFLQGHITPGGGFQGGAVIASAILLVFLAVPDRHLAHGAIRVIESLSGVTYVLIGLLGLALAGGFLDSRFLPLGELGAIVSAGAIPIIYTLIGLKVGTELVSILASLRGGGEEVAS
jgi:multicomponent Na+:H+ antiporter subunit B